MKLDELHVGDPASGPPGHGDAIARGAVGGVAVDARRAARGQHRDIGPMSLHISGSRIDESEAEAAIGSGQAQLPRRQQVGGEPVLQQLDVRVPPNALCQHAHDRPPGGVVGVHDPAPAVTALARQVQFGAAVAAGELHAVPLQPADAFRAFADDPAHDIRIAEARAGLDGIGLVVGEGILRAHDRGDSALGVVAGGLAERGLGDHRRPVPRIRQPQRRAQPGDTAADDENPVFAGLMHGCGRG